MSKKNDNPEASAPLALHEFTPAEIAKARQCFTRGQELAGKKNYDYAVEMYINGLQHWPEAIDEGHQPCRASALFRGKTKIGFGDQRKYKTNVKNTKEAMLNAEMLLSKDPHNITYMEAMFKNAAKGRYYATAMWIGEIFHDAAVKEAKSNPARFILLREVYEEMGDALLELNPPLAILAMEKAVEALTKLYQLKPGDMEVSTDLRDVAGKLTILRGKYSSAESFTESVRDSDQQRELHDKERLTQSDDRLDDLVRAAMERYQDEPTHKPTINDLVTLLCRREDEKYENRAIKVLLKAFQDTEDYDHKRKADDVRIKQLRRHVRLAKDRESSREALKTQLRFELTVHKERTARYPSDLRMKYQLGITLFRAGRYDDAIPVLQEARMDPKTRVQCSLYLGRSFYQKGYFSQSADTFTDALKAYQIHDDDFGKELHYWLGRAQEADAKLDEALKTYGQLIQWDYNYRDGDVRKRIDDLRKQT